MTMTRKEEARALDADEREMIAATHHPEVQALPDAELTALTARLRDRRDRAQGLARQRRRELRGKGAPRGAEPASTDRGARAKADILAAAMRRLNAEVARRRAMLTRQTMAESQRRAQAMAAAAEAGGHADFNARAAHEGMNAKTSRRRKSIGSAREAGRVSQFVRNAQAKRDAR